MFKIKNNCNYKCLIFSFDNNLIKILTNVLTFSDTKIDTSH